MVPEAVCADAMALVVITMAVPSRNSRIFMVVTFRVRFSPSFRAPVMLPLDRIHHDGFRPAAARSQLRRLA
jgi:hypothetical protein